MSEVEKKFCVKLRLITIPREALEVSHPAKEKVRFFDLGDLELAHQVSGKTVTITIKDFRPGNLEYLPKESRAKERGFSDFIDYWAVDWDYGGDAFGNRWRAFRTRKKPKLSLKATHIYATAGTYKVLVKVVDVFANETNRVLEAKVPQASSPSR